MARSFSQSTASAGNPPLLAAGGAGGLKAARDIPFQSQPSDANRKLEFVQQSRSSITIGPSRQAHAVCRLPAFNRRTGGHDRRNEGALRPFIVSKLEHPSAPSLQHRGNR